MKKWSSAKFENHIHSFFGSSCLEVDVFDENGRRHTPREWFMATLDVIEIAIQLIISGDIIEYRYYADNEAIAQR